MAGYQINPDKNIEKTMRTVQFFNLYFEKFKYIFLANILFIMFNAAAVGWIYLTYIILDGINIIAAASSIIILNVGMAGITNVCRYIYTKKEFSMKKAFFGGLKENGLKFLLHGVVFYMVFSVSYSSLALYYNGTKSNFLFWGPFIITALISIFVLFASYYLNIMTATMDLSLKNIYRNCILFSFGEIKNNFLATIALLIFGAVIFTIAVIINRPIIILALCGIIGIFIAPSTIQYIITFYVYDSMIDILDESTIKEKSEEKNEKPKININRQEAEEMSKIANESHGSSKASDEDEYIYYNGKMVKRSLLDQSNEYND